jgi:hypothetical protein
MESEPVIALYACRMPDDSSPCVAKATIDTERGVAVWEHGTLSDDGFVCDGEAARLWEFAAGAAWPVGGVQAMRDWLDEVHRYRDGSLARSLDDARPASHPL